MRWLEALYGRLHQVRSRACMAEMKAAEGLRYVGAGSGRGCSVDLNYYDGHVMTEPVPVDHGPRLRLTLRYRGTLFYIENTRTPLDSGELQFWDIFASRDEGYRDTTDAWFVRVSVDVPRRQVHIIRRYEYHADGYLADETYERIITAGLQCLACVDDAYLSRKRPTSSRGFHFHPNPLDPVKVAECQSILQWIMERTWYLQGD